MFGSDLISSLSGMVSVYNDFINYRVTQVVRRVAREDRVSRVRKYTFSTTFFQSFSSFTQRTASVDHIIDQYAVTTCTLTDDMHHL